MAGRISKNKNGQTALVKNTSKRPGRPKKGEKDIRITVRMGAVNSKINVIEKKEKELFQTEASFVDTSVNGFGQPQPRFDDAHIVYEREERKKIMMMWVGVGFFMFLIVSFWIYDTKKVFKQSRAEAVNNGNDFSFDKFVDSVREMTAKIDEFQQELATSSLTLATTTIDGIATGTKVLPTLSTSTIDAAVPTVTALSQKSIIEELENKLIASSTKGGQVKGVFEKRDIIKELKDSLEGSKRSYLDR